MKDKRLITLDNRYLIKDKRLITFVYEDERCCPGTQVSPPAKKIKVETI